MNMPFIRPEPYMPTNSWIGSKAVSISCTERRSKSISRGVLPVTMASTSSTSARLTMRRECDRTASAT